MRATLLNRILIGLGLVGLFVAGTLSLAKYQNKILPCGLEGSCQAVSDHPSAYWFGIPVAYFGLLGYVLLTLLAVAREVTGRETSRALVLPGYIGSAFGFLASAYLQWVSFFVIRAKCTWCIASAVLMLVTFLVYTRLAGEMGSVVGEHERPRTRSWPAILAGVLLAAGATIGIPTVFGARNDVRPVKVTDAAQLIPYPRNQTGPDDAPVTVVEFGDYACPACRSSAPKVKELADRYARKLRLIYRHFPLIQTPGHEMSYATAIASEYAADKGKFWPFHDRVMNLANPITKPEEILSVAGSVGLDELAVGKLIDVNNKSPQNDRVYRDLSDGIKLEVGGTPTFFLVVKGKAPVQVKLEGLTTMLESGELAPLVR